MMLGSIGRISFPMSLYRNILVNDPSPFDILINDLPPKGLEENVSRALQIPYLSKYEGSYEEVCQKLKYKGKIIGDHSRIFFSIPTAFPKTMKYYYVHYLLDTGSPYTTLTHQALCCLYGRKYSRDSFYIQSLNFFVGGKNIEINLSNPDPTDENPTHNYHNVNLLGMNFLRRFKSFKIQGIYDDVDGNVVTLELTK